jgi:tetratricopeptide (TPR) repeat protein
MSQYYIKEGEVESGPFSIKQLRFMDVTADTMVRAVNATEWQPFEVLYPVLDDEHKQPAPKTVTPQHIEPYKKEWEATAGGIAYIVVQVSLMNVIQSSHDFAPIGLVIYLVMKIFCMYWLMKIVGRQNREKTGWFVAGLLSTPISLIVIGQLKRVRINMSIDEDKPLEDQVGKMVSKAEELYEQDRKAEALEILDEAITADSVNRHARELRGIIRYEEGDFNKAKGDLEIACFGNAVQPNAKFYLGNVEIKTANLDEAVNWWKAAQAEGHINASIQLDRYFNFRGKYLLDKDEVLKKTSIDFRTAQVGVKVLHEITFLSGLEAITSGKVSFNNAMLFANKIGLAFKIGAKGDSYLGIHYFEISSLIQESGVVTFDIFNIEKPLQFRYFQDDHAREFMDFIMEQYHLSGYKSN